MKNLMDKLTTYASLVGVVTALVVVFTHGESLTQDYQRLKVQV